MLARIVTGLFAMSAAVPGTASPAQAGPALLPPRVVVAGEVLKPKPPAFVAPVRGYRLTGRFGAGSYLWSTVHTGLDFAAAAGTEIRAVAAGRVVEAGYDGRYGNKTVLRLADGTEVWFCHQDSIAVGVGEHVRAGQVIGTIGTSGNTTGPHLHLEVHPGAGAPVDPAAWLAGKRVRVA